MSMLAGLSQKWDLDSIFPGGSGSPEYHAHLDALEADIAAFTQGVQAAEAPQTEQETGPWLDLLDRVQALSFRLWQGGAFMGCLRAQDVTDQQAKVLGGRVMQLGAALRAATAEIDGHLLAIPDPVWESILQSERIKEFSWPLNQRRERAREKFEPKVEAMLGDLSVDGYHAWGQLYQTIVGRMSLTVADGGKEQKLSMGQAYNRLNHPDRSVRAETLRKWEEVWKAEEDLCAEALNHIGGFRWAMYKHRGWESILKETLDYNKVSLQALEAMWSTIERNKAPMANFLERKAQIYGVERLDWHDLEAPVGTAVERVEYDEAANLIIEQFSRFNPALADFSARAFRERWIEAEDRPGKAPGGFCSPYPLSGQSRIFLTYANDATGVATLAHELGHAYHFHVMWGLPMIGMEIGSALAETASTFGEMAVSDAAVKAARSREEKVALLADKAHRVIAFCMNIHARFLFETRFYAERKRGLVPASRLNSLMLEAQKEAYRESLGEYHPRFWASKGHFYGAANPFYNWPYTFGYLFSAGLYARALAEGPSFAPRYDALLRDTGRLPTDELARRYLGTELDQPEFWQSALDVVLADVAEFMALTERPQ